MSSVHGRPLVIEWSDEDGAFIGSCPGVIGPCCHGPDEDSVRQQLTLIVEDWLEWEALSGRRLPDDGPTPEPGD